MSEFKHIRTEMRDGVRIVRFTASRMLDEMQIQEIAQELGTLVDSNGPRLLVDFTGVEFITSAMLGKLISLQRKVRQQSGMFGFCSIGEQVMEVFKVSKLDTYFPIFASLASGVVAMQ